MTSRLPYVIFNGSWRFIGDEIEFGMLNRNSTGTGCPGGIIPIVMWSEPGDDGDSGGGICSCA